MPPPPTQFFNFDSIIVHKTVKLYSEIRITLRKFPKIDRYALGLRIENLILEILELFVLALNKSGKSKLLILEKADVKLKLLKLLIRLSNDYKITEDNRYIILSEQIVEIGKILGGWLKKAKEKL